MSKSNAFTQWLCEGVASGAAAEKPAQKAGKAQKEVRQLVNLALVFLADGNAEAAKMALELIEVPLMEAMDPAQVGAKLSSLIQQAKGVASEVPYFGRVSHALDDAAGALAEELDLIQSRHGYVQTRPSGELSESGGHRR